MSCWRSWTWEREKSKNQKTANKMPRSFETRLFLWWRSAVNKQREKQQTNKRIKKLERLRVDFGGGRRREEARDATRSRVARPLRSQKTAIVRVCDEADEKDDVSSWSSDFFIIIHLYHPQSYVYFRADYHPSVPPKVIYIFWGRLSSIHMAIQYCIRVRHPSILPKYMYIFGIIHPYHPKLCVFLGRLNHPSVVPKVCMLWAHLSSIHSV